MFRRIKIRMGVLIALVIIALTTPDSLAPQAAAEIVSNTENARTDVIWSVDAGQTLTRFSQEITFVDLDWDDHTNYWRNWHHSTLCWSRGNSLLASGDTCSWFGIGLQRKQGENYLGTFDFTFIEGASFRNTSNSTQSNCRRDNSTQGVSAYTTCWVPIQVQMNRKYLLELVHDPNQGSNWWKAVLTDAVAQESVTLGSIEATHVSDSTRLTSYKNHTGYAGKSVACEKIPKLDTLLSEPTVNGKKLNYKEVTRSSCIRADVAVSSGISAKNYLLLIGGSSPITRDRTFRITRIFFTNGNITIEGSTGLDVGVNPERVFLAIPKLGIETGSPRLGTINGKTVTWTIPFETTPDGREIEAQIFGESAGVRFASAKFKTRLPGVKCPKITDTQLGASQPKVVGFTFTGTGQRFVQVDSVTQAPVTKAASLVGCYIVPTMINFESVDWQIGTINRDSLGFFFLNAAGVSWRLSLIDNGTRLEAIDTSAPYFADGKHFNLELRAASDSDESRDNLRPIKPTFSLVNFVGNKINVNVNLGSSTTSRPNKVYLVAPTLGFTLVNPLEGTISGSRARWSLELDRDLSGSNLPIEIIGERDGVRSDSLIGTYRIPSFDVESGVTAVPVAPKEFKSRISGDVALVTVVVTHRAGAPAEGIYLYGRTLGVEKSQALSGEVIGKRGLLEVPLRPSMIGKRFPVKIFFTNQMGDSEELSATLSIPATPSSTSLPTIINPKKSVATILCVRSNQSRVFQGSKCPPGWKSK